MTTYKVQPSDSPSVSSIRSGGDFRYELIEMPGHRIVCYSYDPTIIQKIADLLEANEEQFNGR